MSENTLEFIVKLSGGPSAAADARQVAAAVKQVGGEVRTTGKESLSQSKNISRFGGGLKQLALGLGAVGLGYKAWSSAKNAISWTGELTRNTNVLSKATGLSVGKASSLIAVSSALGVESTKLAQVFTKLGSATVKQAEHTGKTITAFDRLGITQKVAQEHLNDTGGVLDLVTTALATKHIPALEKSKLLTELFGRSWLPLGRIFLEGGTQFKHLTEMAKEFGLELGGNTTKELEKLKDQQEEYTLATDGLKVSFTKIVAGPLGGMLTGFAKLTIYAKQGNWKMFNKEVEKIAGSFEVLAEKVLPKVAESFARIAPAIFKAFWKGFVSAPIGTEAVLAGLLLTKMGLTGSIFRGAGTALGKKLVEGVGAETVAADAAGAGLGGAFALGFLAVAAGYFAGSWLNKLLPNGLFGKPEPTTAEASGTLAGKGSGKGLRVENGELRPNAPTGGNKAELGGSAVPVKTHGASREVKVFDRAVGREVWVHPGETLPGPAPKAKGSRASTSSVHHVVDQRPIVVQIGQREIARAVRNETLETQAAGG